VARLDLLRALIPIALEPRLLSPSRPWLGISEDKRLDAGSDFLRTTAPYE
jgi:hypothetical protein